MEFSEWVPPDIDTGRPSPARRLPEVALIAHANRSFLRRAARQHGHGQRALPALGHRAGDPDPLDDVDGRPESSGVYAGVARKP